MTLVPKMKNHIEERAKQEILSRTNSDSQILEALGILQEECAEVIQNVSKCRRFGLENGYLNGEGTQRENLEREIGDMLCLVDYLVDKQILSNEKLSQAKQAKKTKLQKWSKIYE